MPFFLFTLPSGATQGTLQCWNNDLWIRLSMHVIQSAVSTTQMHMPHTEHDPPFTAESPTEEEIEEQEALGYEAGSGPAVRPLTPWKSCCLHLRHSRLSCMTPNSA